MPEMLIRRMTRETAATTHFITLGYIRLQRARGRIEIALDNTCTFHVHATNTITRLFNGTRVPRETLERNMRR